MQARSTLPALAAPSNAPSCPPDGLTAPSIARRAILARAAAALGLGAAANVVAGVATANSEPVGPNDALLLELERQLAAVRVHLDALNGRSNADPDFDDDGRCDEAIERICSLQDQIYLIRPETIRGLAAKARVIRRDVVDDVECALSGGYTADFAVILDLLAQDAERIAEGLAS